MNLFEPPSSVEGMGRGKKEVRGHLGSSSSSNGNNAATTTATNNNNNNNNNNGMGMGGVTSTTTALIGESSTTMTVTSTTSMGVGGVGAVSPSMNGSLLNESSNIGTTNEMMAISETSFMSIDCSGGGSGGRGVGGGAGAGGGGGGTTTRRPYSPVEWIRGWMGGTGGSPPPPS